MAAYRMGKDLYPPHIDWSIRYTKNLRNWSSAEEMTQLKKKWGAILNRELLTDESKITERQLRNA